MTCHSPDCALHNFTKISHLEGLPCATLQGLSSHLRVPEQVFSCSPASPDADEESAFLHKKNSKMRKATTKATSPDMYEVVTNRIIERLEKGELAWCKTWSSYGLARNYVSGKVYRGINMLMMNFFSPHSTPYYLTYKQAQDLGGNVKKGAKAQQVIYFNVIFKDANDQMLTKEVAGTLGDGVKVMKFLKYYNVFNVEDIEGVEFKIDDLRLLPNEKIERCEKVVNGYPSPPNYFFEDKRRAFYSPMGDFINMPPIEQHESAEFYYSTFFHEMIHSTGHAKRLAREEVVTPNRFGSIPYSQEELVAELGASFLCGLTG